MKVCAVSDGTSSSAMTTCVAKSVTKKTTRQPYLSMTQPSSGV
jgi:hypothetical protein